MQVYRGGERVTARPQLYCTRAEGVLAKQLLDLAATCHRPALPVLPPLGSQFKAKSKPNLIFPRDPMHRIAPSETHDQIFAYIMQAVSQPLRARTRARTHGMQTSLVHAAEQALKCASVRRLPAYVL